MKVLLATAALLAAWTHGHEIEKRQASEPERRVVCYYTNWSVYRRGIAKYTPQNINPYLCTHLIYAFGGLTDEFEVKPFDTYQDIEQGGYAKFNGLKQYNKGLKTLLAIGGWNEGSGRFSELVSLPEYRKTFIISAIRHLRRYNFDGLDLDWEYPASRDGSAPEDRENYAALVKELRDAFEDEGSKVKKGKLLLTMAVPAGQNYIDKGYDVPSLSRDLDFINILNYDYHSAYEPTINHHAALLPAPGTSEYEWNAQLNVDWTVKYYISLGAERQKLVIGIPTYGRSYTLLDGNFTDFGASADGPGEQGKYTKENGFMAFYEVCENIASHGWDVRKPYPRRIGPYAYSGDQWVGYDDEKIVARKAEYVREEDLGGIMFWSLDNDDFRGICNGEQYPLVEAGKKALFGAEETQTNEARKLTSTSSTRGSVSDTQRQRNTFRTTTQEPEPQQPRRRPSTTRGTQGSTRTRGRFRTQDTTTTTPEPFRTAEGGSSARAGQRVRGGTQFRGARPQTDTDRSTRVRVSNERPRGTSLTTRLNRPRTRTTPAPTTTTTTTPRPTRPTTPARTPLRRRRPGARPQNRRQQQTTTIDPLNTPAPPTTPSPSTGFSCKREGFYPNPDNCHKYYWCLDSGASGLGIVAHSFTCPSDLVFNKVIDGCDHPDRAKCSTEKKSRGGAGATTPRSSTPIPTTTEIPVDYSYMDDYYYYDYEEELIEPEVVEPVSNAVARKIHNSGGNQFVISDAPAEEPAAPSSRGPGSRSRPQYQSIARQQAQPAAAAEEDSPSPAEPETRGDPLRQYTTIQRSRPPRPQAAAREQEETEAPEAGGSAGGRRNYVNIERPRRPGARSDATEAPFESFEPTQPTLEYVTLQRRTSTTSQPSTTAEEELPTTFEETTVASTFPTGDDFGVASGGAALEDYYYVDDLTYDDEAATSSPAKPQTISDTTTTPTTTTTTPIPTTTTTTTTTTPPPTTPTRRTSRPRTRTRVRGRPVTGSSSRSQESSAGPGERRTSTLRRRLPSSTSTTAEGTSVTGTTSTNVEVVKDVEVAQEEKEEVLATPTAGRRPGRLRPNRPNPQTRRRIVVRKRVEDDARSDQAQSPTSGPARIRPRPTASPRLTTPRALIRPRLRPSATTAAPPPPPTTLEPAIVEEETFVEEEIFAPEEDFVLEEEFVPDTTAAPETSVRPTIKSLLSPRPRPSTTPAPRTPAPTTPAPTTPRLLTPRPTAARPVRPRPSFRTTTPRPSTTRPPPRSPRPPRPVTQRAPPAPVGPAASSIIGGDYFDYYYDDLEQGALTGTLGQLATLTEKAVLMPDGSVTCYDTGYFAHPESCKKFISCSKTVRGLVRGWVYTCPQQLVFDPVGGMCNWAEAVDCIGAE
ncbi:mucin-2-like isoform X2 [Penaeus indicus]|uniref:mucin-2-like isoform X2 n=1 Tax=Penaeus indicus TaxID=29960 RepID=UPI00300D1DB8